MWQNETAAAKHARTEMEAKLNGPSFFDTELVLQIEIPKHVFYIFNVGPMEFTVPKGSAGPAGGYKIKSCEKGRPYSTPLILPSIVTDTYMQEDMIKTHSVTGEFMCRDIVHPMVGKVWSIGQNLDDFGVFWTRNNPPANSELEEAKFKMEITFRAALAEANMLEAQNRFDLITPLMRFAASYYEEDRKWNQVYKRTIECPVCGGPMKAGIAIHSCGAVLDWPAAIFNSARSFDDAKKHGVFSMLLEKQVAELRYKAANKQTFAPAPAGQSGSSFLSSAELIELEREETTKLDNTLTQAGRGDDVRTTAADAPDKRDDVPSPSRTRSQRAKVDADLDAAHEARGKSGKKPPAPKRPKNFKA